MDIKFFQENELWKHADKSGVYQGIPLGGMYYLINESAISIRNMGEPTWLFHGVEITSILKSDTPNDFYADIAEFLSINESFFVKASASGGTTEKATFVATQDQKIFVATFTVVQVFVDSILQEDGFAGTTTITFAVGLNAGQRVTLFS